MKRGLLIPDCHIPYHDKKAWSLLLKTIKQWKPDICVIMGDFADFYSVSSHQKQLSKRNFMLEVAAVNKALDDLDKALPDKCRKEFVEGNHEYRLDRYLMDKAPDLFEFVKTRELLKLKARGWNYTSYKKDLKIGKLYVTHDVGYAGKDSARRNLDAYQHNVVTGHTHRLQCIVEGNAAGEAHVSAMFGWLGDRKQVDYMHRLKAARDWTLGFGTFYLEKDGTVHIQPVPIVKYRCLVEGRLIKV